MYRVNKEKCLGIDMCGICMQNCPGATKKGDEGKSEIIDQKKIEECGGESVCPMGAIEKVEEDNSKLNTEEKQSNQNSQQPENQNIGRQKRKGRGRGKHLGRKKGGRGKGK